MSTRNRFPVPKTPEERAEYVATHFDPRSQQIPDNIRQLIRQVREDFRALKPGETIHDCRTWEAFCKRVLHRTTRAVLYIMAGGNPRSKRKASQRNGSQPHDDQPDDDQPDDDQPDDNFEPDEHWKKAGMPECDNDDLTAFQTIKVHFETRKDRKAFEKLIGQEMTDNTRSIWFPETTVGHYAGTEYVAAEPEPVEVAS